MSQHATRHPRGTSGTRSVSAAMAAVAVIVACAPVSQQDAGRRECPHTWDSTLAETDARFGPDVARGVLSVPGPNQNVPEYNDCQRFIRGPDVDNLEYTDGYFAVFAHQRLDARLAVLDSAAVLPVAEIYAEEDYPALNIKQGFNCLVLYRRTGRIHAKMRPVGALELQCGEPVDPEDELDPSLTLAVAVDAIGAPEVQGLTVPPVARWGHNLTRTQHTVEIKCGEYLWCSIGGTEFQRLPSFAERMAASDLASLPPQKRWIRRVKGLYDEQFLAVQRTGSADLVPSNVFAQLFPIPHAGRLDTSDVKSKFDTTAFVAMSGTLQLYKDKFNYDPSPDGVSVTKVLLCMGSRAECGIPTDITIPACNVDPSVDPSHVDANEWWAKMVGTDGSELYRCVTRYIMPGFVPPPSARFRWTLRDEGGWERCPDGCCEWT